VLAFLAYAGDALSILALSIMFSLSLAVQKAVPGVSRVKVWALPALAVIVSFPLGYMARTWPTAFVEAGIVFGARSLLSALFAILHLSFAQRR
jgi:hypothetical protein